jgi:hypothetical protein
MYLPGAILPPVPLAGDSGESNLETFRNSIQAFVRLGESNPPSEYAINRLLCEFGFQKRRLYDVTSVLAAIGCCRKISVDSIFWAGLAKVPPALTKLQRDAGADTPVHELDHVIRSQATVSIARLTVSFMLCFLVLREPTLDIKVVSRYLSRKTGRDKSTLCKLYQIAHILEASGVLTRCFVPGQLRIVDRFFVPIGTRAIDPKQTNPFAIDSLLNRVQPSDDAVIQKRRTEFTSEASGLPGDPGPGDKR